MIAGAILAYAAPRAQLRGARPPREQFACAPGAPGGRGRRGQRRGQQATPSPRGDAGRLHVACALAVRDPQQFDGEGEDGLPLRYDPAASAAYFRSRPLAVVSRAAEILGLSANFGLALLADGKLGKEKENRKRRARQLKNLLTALGPTFVKAGQAVSIRVDLLPAEYLAELRQLQDNVPAFPTEVARRTIERELKMPAWRGGVNELFSDFPDAPVAAASLGQVYRARLKSTGQEVAVKVQRPNMQTGILLDLFLLRTFAPIFRRAKNLNTDLVGVVDEWGVRFVDELDYRREAANATAFGAAMRARGLTSLCTAETVDDFCTKAVLTTEWVDGTRLDASTVGDEARLCGLALNGYLTMLLDTGVLHADPHPGNLLRTVDGRLCILDFGLVTELTPDQQYSIIEYISHLISENFLAVPGDLGRLGFVPEGKEAAMTDSEVVRVLAEAFGRLAQGGGARSLRASAGIKQGGGVDELGKDLKEIVDKWGNLFQIPPYFAYILRAFSVLEGIGLQCDPDYTIAQECYPYLARRLFTDDSPRGRAALKEMLYGSGDQKALNVRRLTRLSTAAQTFREQVVEAPAGAAAARASPAASTPARNHGTTASTSSFDEVANLLLAPNGNYLQTLLVKEAVRMTDVMTRDSLLRAAASPAGQLAKSAVEAQKQAAEVLGPARPFLMPFPLASEVAEWAAPILSRRDGDEEVLESSKELWALLEPVLQSSLAAPSPALDGPEGLERLPREAVEAVQQYSPGLQTVADAFRTELLALAESRTHELTRGERLEVAFPFPQLPELAGDVQDTQRQ